MVGGNWLKSIFFLFLDHLPGFPNYTFLNFQKKFFSLHPSSRKLKFGEVSLQICQTFFRKNLAKKFLTGMPF